jgi:hypothetical protein
MNFIHGRDRIGLADSGLSPKDTYPIIDPQTAFRSCDVLGGKYG